MRKARAVVAVFAILASVFVALGCNEHSATPNGGENAAKESPIAPPSPALASHAPTHAAKLEPNELVDELVRQDLDAELYNAPITATWLGVHNYDDRIDDVRPESQAHEATRLRMLLERLRSIDPSVLDPGHAFDRMLLMHRADTALYTMTDLKPLERNPLVYIDLAQSAIYELISDDFLPAVDRLRNINARLWKLRPLLDDARRNLRATASDLAIRRAVDEAQSAKGFIAETLPRALQNVSDPKGKLTEELRAASGDASRALDDFAGWLQHDLLPRAHGEPALGRDRLLELLRRSEAIDTTPEQLVAIGERELKDARHRYDDAAHALAAGHPAITDVGKALEDDHGKSEELLPSAQAQLEAAVAFVRSQHLFTLPTPERPKVIEMPPVLWGYMQLQMAGPLEQRPRDPNLFVDPVPADKSWTDKHKPQDQLRLFNRSVMIRTILHDAVGHYAQAELDRHAPTTMQKIALSPLFVEGWAGYVEEMMLSEGFLPGDAKVRVSVARATMLRAARLVAVVRLHALGAKPDDVQKVFTDEAGLDDYQARREVERAATDPLVLGDALGRVVIDKLRDDWRAAHPGATLGAFHDAFLRHGTPPPALLRRLMLPTDTASPL
ncbi:MAG TPA: DUF885 family protein [Polyangia bacterium]|jgi:uncharacterized protein (DUF885 family)|nr:DUF885 family protein [Polyangia bacterium]